MFWQKETEWLDSSTSNYQPKVPEEEKKDKAM